MKGALAPVLASQRYFGDFASRVRVPCISRASSNDRRRFTSRIVCRRLQRHVPKTFYKATTTRAAMRCDCRHDGSTPHTTNVQGVD